MKGLGQFAALSVLSASLSASLSSFAPVATAESPSIYIKQGTWNVSQKSCLEKGMAGLKQNKFQGLKGDKASISGFMGNYRAVVTCEAIEGVTDRIWYLIVVSGPALPQSKQLAQAIDKAMD